MKLNLFSSMYQIKHECVKIERPITASVVYDDHMYTLINRSIGGKHTNDQTNKFTPKQKQNWNVVCARSDDLLLDVKLSVKHFFVSFHGRLRRQVDCGLFKDRTEHLAPSCRGVFLPVDAVMPHDHKVGPRRLIVEVVSPLLHCFHHPGKVSVTYDPVCCLGTHVGFVGCRGGAIHADHAVCFIDVLTGFGSYESTSTVDDCTGAARLLYRL